jgi:hypothetical protein
MATEDGCALLRRTDFEDTIPMFADSWTAPAPLYASPITHRIVKISYLYPPEIRRVKERAKIGIFWPGDYRSKPNELARPNAEMLYAER